MLYARQMRLVAFLLTVAAPIAACGSFGAAGPAGSGPGSDDAGADAPPAAAEDCLDGTDENNNGKTDCEEPSCAPYARCAPAPTAYPGWAGYATVVPAAAPCPKDLPVSAEAWAADDDAATCPTCKCQAQVTCPSSANVGESAIAGCNQGVLPFTANTTCTAVPALTAAQTARYWIYAAEPTGTCVSTTVDSPTPAATKHHAVRVCSGPRFGGGCPPDQVCAPVASSGLCLSRPTQSGLLACPAAFPVLRLTAPKEADPEAAFADQRACAACSCDAKPKGVTCAVKLDLYSDASCATNKGSVASGVCSDVSCNGVCKSAKLTATQTSSGTCGASGGGATGKVELAVPGTQFCCDR
jgi:hypothetical protein